MRKKGKRILTVLLVVSMLSGFLPGNMVPNETSAAVVTDESGDWQYEIREYSAAYVSITDEFQASAYGAVITKYLGTDANVTIPEKLGGYEVVALVGGVFSANRAIISVDMPDTVIELFGNSTFRNCTNLKSVNLSETLFAISSACFQGCTSLTDIVFPDSMALVNSYALQGCTSLKSVTFGTGMGRYGNSTGNGAAIQFGSFQDCINLETVTFYNPNKGIGIYGSGASMDPAFMNTPKLSTVYGYSGSTAEDFAKGNGLNFIPLSEMPEKTIDLFVRKDNTTYRNVKVTDEKGVTLSTDILGKVRFPVDEFMKDKIYTYIINLDKQSYKLEIEGASLKNISFEEADADRVKGEAFYKYINFRTLKVNAQKDGEPVPDADVRFDTTGAAVQKTNAEGIAEFFFLDSKMPTGITVEADGKVWRKELEAHEILSGEIIIDCGSEDLENPLISGKVSHAGSGISGVILTAQKENGNLLYAKSKVDGSYRFILPKEDEGAYTVKVIDSGGYDKGVLRETEKAGVAVGSEENDFIFADGFNLKGTVTDTGNKPLAGVKLYLEEENTSGQKENPVRFLETNEAGEYYFAALEGGNYRLSYGLTNYIYSGSESMEINRNITKDIVMTGYSVTNPRNITYDITVKSPVEHGTNGLVSVRCQNNDSKKYENLILEVNIPEGVIIEDAMLGQGQDYIKEEQKVRMQVDLGRKGDLSGTDSVVFSFMYRLENNYSKNKVVFTAYAREEAAVSDPLKEFEITQFDWKRTEESKTIARKSSNPVWKWSELSGLTLGLGDDDKVWDGQNDRYFDMYASDSNITKDYATWEYHSTKGVYDYRRFQSGFTRPSKSYNFSHILSENYAAYSGSGAVFPINDEIFMFVYPKGTRMNDDNAGQYLAFWGSTQLSKYPANRFMGVDGNNAIWYKTSGEIPAIQHSDYWVLDGSRNRVQEIMDENTDTTEFVIDVFTCDFAQGGGMDKFNLVFTNSEIPGLDTGNTSMPYVDFIGLGHADLFRPTLTGDECVTVDFVKSNEYELRGESMKNSHVTIIGLDEEKEAADFDTPGVYSGVGTLLPPVPGTYAFVAVCKKGDAVQYSNIHVVEVIEEKSPSKLQLTSATLDRTTEYGPKPFVTIYTMIGSHVRGIVDIASSFNEELKGTDEVYYKLTGSNHSYEADRNLKTSVKLEDSKVKYVSVFVVRNGRVIFSQVIGQIYIGIDPSGYVYDKHTGKRIEGATATCYVRNEKGEWEFWPAKDYGQINPQITDENGKYAWDVPEGVYKVTVSKEGYEDYDTLNDVKYAFEPGVESSIIIPPPRLDINIGIKNIEKPNITDSFPKEGDTVSPDDILRFTFNKSLDAESLAGNIRLAKGNQPIDFSFGINTTQDVITVMPEPVLEEGDYTLTFTEGIQDYVKEKNLSETALSFTVSEQAEVRSEPFRLEEEELNVGMNDDIVLHFNQKIKLGTKPDGSADNYAVIVSGSGEKTESELALGEDGKSLIIKPKENLKASSEYTITLSQIESEEGFLLPVKSVTIQTAEKVKTPAANQESGSLLPAGSEIIFTSLTEDAVIRYTTDNSEPDESSNEYREPIVLQNNTVIKAAAFKEGMEQSETAVFTFLTEARALDIEETSRIAIDYIQERITGFISDEKYTINGTPYVPADTNRAIDDTWFGTALTIMKNGKEGVTIDSELQNLSIPQRPEAPDSLGVEGNRIIGVTAAMEYRNIEEDEWTACAGTQITGLSAGMYDIRFKAVAGVSFASQIETIRLREVLTPPPPIKNTNSPSPKETASPAVTKEPVLTAAPEETPTLSSPNRILKITPPKKPSSVKVKNKKGKKLLVSWKKVPQANGYQAVIAQNKKFTKAKKTKNTATVKWTFKKLKKKKTYYVRVRAYRKSGKQKIYGKWSARKKIKIRK